jgi:hypothetical protein
MKSGAKHGIDAPTMVSGAVDERVSRLGRDLDAVVGLPIRLVVEELIEALGAQLVAAIAGVGETRLVRSWERGERQPSREASLRAALQATRAILATAGPPTAKAWFLGCSSRLQYTSPLEVIREDTEQARTQTVRAAVGFSLQ